MSQEMVADIFANEICQRVDADVFLYYYYHTDNFRIVTSTQK
jgi:hypothetical protein